MPINILLVDDQMLVREGIKSLLDLSPKVTVVGEAEDGTGVLDAVHELSPDVILLDLSMPVMDGIETLDLLASRGIDTPVIILTTFDDHEITLKAIQGGAKGYLLKDVSLETLVDGIEAVHGGKRLVQPAVTERLLKGLKGFRSEFQAADIVEALTPREHEVLGLMASGYSNREISDALSKSEGTIKNHVSNVLGKLGVRDRTRAVLVAIEKGVL